MSAQFDLARALPRRLSIRIRLTTVYGAMFFVAGVVLLTVTYFIVRAVLSGIVVTPPADTPLPPEAWRQVTAELTSQYRAQVLAQLLRQSLIALVVVGLLAVGLGYLVADRALRPLQRVTATARRLSESTLHERISLQGPEDEIKELADTFDAMLARLQWAFEAQRRFVANASHELRTPLAINRTLLEVALADPEASQDLKAVGRSLLATNSRHQRLIDGLLLLARSERELSARVAVDLRDAAVAALDALGDDIGRSGLTVHRMLDESPTAGDPVLLERCVFNLVENAVRHNITGGQLSVRTGRWEGGAACQVENTGPFVPPYEVETLFEPFRRLNGERTGSERGAGLGLSIVRSIVRAHGGNVTAVPRPDGGLVVTVRLPG